MSATDQMWNSKNLKVLPMEGFISPVKPVQPSALSGILLLSFSCKFPDPYVKSMH